MILNTDSSLSAFPLNLALASQQPSDPQSPGNISGTIVDATGASVVGARVRLISKDQSVRQEVLSGENGEFSFTNVTPGRFQITVESAGFAVGTCSGVLQPGQSFRVSRIELVVASPVTQVQVMPSRAEVAEDEIKEEEKQRVLGFVPNFYVSYIPNAVPLTSKQKFELAWKTSVDPVTFGISAAIGGIQQAQDDFSGYGQGAQGYAKRFGASYADGVTSTFIGGAILPSLLKQDPRYFYRGSGSKRSRVLYAIANAFICKGDDGHWQPNYSSILGNLAAGGISNLYYPASDREGAELTLENTLIGIGATAATNILQEFVIRRLTPKIASHSSSNP